MSGLLLASAALAALIDATAPNGEVLRTVKLLPMGKISPADGRGPWLLENLAHAQQVVAASLAQAGGTDLVFDYDHQSVFGAKDGVGGRAPAAGWIKRLEARPDGIWAEVEWTPAAAAALAAREYRYVSPYFFHEKSSGRVTRIANASLVNMPAIKELPAVAQESLPMDPTIEAALAALRVIYGLPETAASDAIVEAARSAQASATASVDPARFVPIETLEAVTAQLAAANRGISEEAAVIAVDREINAGRLIPALRDWGLALCSQNKPAFDGFVERTSGGLQSLFDRSPLKGRPADQPTPLDEEIARNLGLTA